MADPITTPAIAELWRKFQESIAKAKAHERDAKIEGMSLSRTVFEVETKNAKALRAQLIERCKRPPRVAMVGSVQLFIDSHKEHSAYHAFKAWELEQRQKEEGGR